MDSRKLPDDDGVIHIQRLDPGRVDVVLGSHPRTKPAGRSGRSRPYGLILALVGLAGIAYWVGSSRLVRPTPAVVTYAAPSPDAAPDPQMLPASQPVTNQAPRPPVQLASYVPPQPATQSAPASAQSLDNCIKQGNVIDESVLNCRFGEVPRPVQTETPNGMVSSRYMAEFKAGARSEEPRQGKSYTQVSMSIREWDGSDRYRAQWRQYGNRIDADTVCENFLNRSVERRECRKSAQVHFKELCREWTKRAARDDDKTTVDTQERYCDVASTFSP